MGMRYNYPLSKRLLAQAVTAAHSYRFPCNFMSSNNSSVHLDDYNLGIQWANCCAAPDQLQRLAILRQRLDASRSLSWKGFFSRNGQCGYSRAELVAFEVLGTENGIKRADASRFWQEILGEQSKKVDELPFLKGFAEGAIDQLGGS